jgi:hypothetical protein
VEKCGRARQATDNSIICCMCVACWITKARATHADIQNMYYSSCFSMATVVTSAGLSVILCVHCCLVIVASIQRW